MRRQGAGRAQQGAVPDGLRRRGHLSGQGAQDNARAQRRVRQCGA